MSTRTIPTHELFPELPGVHIVGVNIDHVVFFTSSGPLNAENIRRYYSIQDGVILPTETFAIVFRALSNASLSEDALALYESCLLHQIKNGNAAVAFALIPPDDELDSMLGKQLGDLFHRMRIPFKVARVEHEATRWVSQFLIRKTGVIPF